jgi:hypothetical protein
MLKLWLSDCTWDMCGLFMMREYGEQEAFSIFVPCYNRRKVKILRAVRRVSVSVHFGSNCD